MTWLRSRFKANEDDYRPVYKVEDGTPGLGPYWCTGYGDGYSIVVAYHRPDTPVTKYWPEAHDIDFTVEDEIKFSDRFPKPEWWDADKENR